MVNLFLNFVFMNLLEAYNKFDYLVVAHRGASGSAPENTLASFHEAIQSGAHLIEMDIQVTSDGVPIVFHDKGLSRTTNGTGIASKMTYKELKQLDSGKWYGEHFAGERIPSLEEVLEFINGRILLDIELKNLGTSAKKHIENIIKILEYYDYLQKVVISSFYYEQLKIVKEVCPSLPIAPIKIPKDNTLPSRLKKSLSCEGYVCSVEEINNEIFIDAKTNGIYIGVYSVDTEEQLDYVISFNVKAIVTNFPEKILNALRFKYHALV